MDFNFAEQLDQGAQAAKITLANREEIAQTFTNFKQSVASFLDIDIAIDLTDETEFVKPDRVGSGLFGMVKPTGYKNVSIKSTEADLKKMLFKYKEDPDGYPIIISYAHERYTCTSQSELINALGQVASDSQIHLIFKAFQNDYYQQGDKP